MAQTRRSSSTRSGGRTARQSGSRRSASSSRKSSSSRGRSASSRSSASRSRSATATKRRAAASKGGQARARQQRARKGAARTASKATRPAARAARRSDRASKAVREFREALADGIVRPTNLVILSRDRIDEVMDDAAKRGRVTMDDAQKLADTLYRRARKETSDVVKDLEQLVGRGRTRATRRTSTARKRGGTAARRTRKQVGGATAKARSRAAKGADPALAQVDRARRAVGLGSSFPITRYDDLTAAQVQGRLSDLKPAQLRKVRDYEKRNANRKSVLGTINQRLG
jgi:polyhydroxyalkanoate synthesis regulator phasin